MDIYKKLNDECERTTNYIEKIKISKIISELQYIEKSGNYSHEKTKELCYDGLIYKKDIYKFIKYPYKNTNDFVDYLEEYNFDLYMKAKKEFNECNVFYSKKNVNILNCVKFRVLFENGDLIMKIICLQNTKFISALKNFIKDYFHDINYISLIDDSVVEWKNQTINLSILSILSDGKSWLNFQDFFQDNYEKEKKLWDLIRNKSMKEYLEEILKTYEKDYILHDNLDFKDELKKNEILVKISKIFNLKGTVGDFFKIIFDDIKKDKDISEEEIGLYFEIIKFCSFRIKYSSEELKFCNFNDKEYIIEDYHLIKILGKGTYGTVYEAKNSLNNHVVIKEVLKTEDMNEYREINNLKLLSKNCSEYFSCFYNYFETPNNLFIIMEYLDNHLTLSKVILDLNKKLLKNKHQALNEIGIIINNLCEGLKTMHSIKLAHNDIKPDNVMINIDNFNIKYIDFGMGCINEECQKILGYTLKYVDPYIIQNKRPGFIERLKKKKYFHIAQQGDLWSLGCVIYKIIKKNTPADNYKNYDKYVEEYTYSKDANRFEIDQVLKSIPNCKINLINLLTREERFI